MVLNGEEIKKGKFVSRAIETNFRAASYDLTVGKIVTMDGKEHDKYTIPPRGMVLIVSEEILDLPNNVVGITTIKNSQSVKGLLAINIGIVDPEWDKPISSAIINFGNSKQRICKGDAFLRMTFQNINIFDKANLTKIENKADDKKNQNIFESYLDDRSKTAIGNLSETFLTINQIKNEITVGVWKRFLSSVAIVAATLAIIGFTASYSVKFVNWKKTLNNKNISNVADSLNQRIDSLQSSVDELQVKIIKKKK